MTKHQHTNHTPIAFNPRGALARLAGLGMKEAPWCFANFVVESRGKRFSIFFGCADSDAVAFLGDCTRCIFRDGEERRLERAPVEGAHLLRLALPRDRANA